MSQEEIEELRVELGALRVRVRLQEEKVERLEERLRVEVSTRRQRSEAEETRSERPSSSVSGLSVSEAGGVGSAGHSLVSEGPEARTSFTSVGSAVSTEDHHGRLRLARACGEFLRRAVQEDYRGPSGRDRLRLQSRLYVVVADFEGVIFDPVKVCHRFSEVRELCKRQSACGRSVFIGFATRWEAEAAVAAGGFRWPQGQ